MPLSPRSTGFSDDGLSYSVAGDYNKLLGQALANYEARVGNPRSFQESDADYATRVGSASGILGNELAPLGISVPRTQQPKLVKSGQDIFAQNAAGGLDLLHSGNPLMSKTGRAAAPVVPETRSQISDWFSKSPTMKAEEAQALESLALPGADAFHVLGTQHPTLLQNSPYSERFGPIYRDAARRHNAIANKPIEPVNPNVSVLSAERARLMKELEANQGLPENTAMAYTNRVNEIDSILQPSYPDESGEVVKRLKDGRSAVFDATTKKFIRYAD